jgi:hypothetical protein
LIIRIHIRYLVATLLPYIKELVSYFVKINLYNATLVSYNSGMVTNIVTVDLYKGFRFNRKVFSSRTYSTEKEKYKTAILVFGLFENHGLIIRKIIYM